MLRHWYYLLHATVWLTLTFARAAWHFRRRALAALELPPSMTLSSRERRRWQHYFYGTTYLGVIFCSLRGRRRSGRERRAFTRLAALAYFFDDLVDTVPAARAYDWEAYGRAEDERGLALHFLHGVYRTLPPADLDEFKRYLGRVFAIEAEGRQRDRRELDLPELEALTRAKGGYSALLFRRALAHPLSPAEQAAVAEFGYLIQLCDDVFDVWFDVGAGTVTAATKLLAAGEIGALRALFERQVAATRAAVLATPFARPRRETCWRVMYFLVALTRVCLQHYEKLRQKHGTLPLADRHAMVVDMERWDNRVRAALELIGRAR
jgi:hypothetical protein